LQRSLRTFFIFAAFLLVLIAIIEVSKTVSYPAKDFITGSVDHLLVVVTAILVGSLLLWIVEESIEKHIAPAIQGGLKKVAAQVAHEVSQFPKSFKDLNQVLDEQKAQIRTPGVKELLEEGKVTEAVEKSKSTEEEIAVLVQSKDPADWTRALELVRGKLPSSVITFLNVAFLLWQLPNLGEAIKVAEEGLKRAMLARNMELTLKLQNSLAYYYAESGKEQFESLAREYTTTVRNATHDWPEALDTDGFVKITYGKTKQEILDGVTLCERARNLGVPFDGFAYAVAKAEKRLKNLN